MHGFGGPEAHLLCFTHSPLIEVEKQVPTHFRICLQLCSCLFTLCASGQRVPHLFAPAICPAQEKQGGKPGSNAVTIFSAGLAALGYCQTSKKQRYTCQG